MTTKQIAVAWCRGARRIFDDQEQLTAYLSSLVGQRVTLRIAAQDDPGLMNWRPEDEPLSLEDRLRWQGRPDAAATVLTLLGPVEFSATDIDVFSPVTGGLNVHWTQGTKRHRASIDAAGAVARYEIDEAP